MEPVTDINIHRLIQQKNLEREEARKEAPNFKNAIDEKGRVRIWMIAEKKWIARWPVDAMDILKSGTANLTGPEPESETEPEPEPEPIHKPTSSRKKNDR